MASVAAARLPADLRWPVLRPPRDELVWSLPRAANSRLRHRPRVRDVRVARYALKRSRSHAGPQDRPAQAPCLYARRSPPARGFAAAILASPPVERSGSSRQAVRGAGPHKGVAPESRILAPQRGYESAFGRVSSRAYVLWLAKLSESGVCPRSGQLQTSSSRGGARIRLSGLPERQRRDAAPAGPHRAPPGATRGPTTPPWIPRQAGFRGNDEQGDAQGIST
jgi:hypothetical protein